jgi:Fic family protein
MTINDDYLNYMATQAGYQIGKLNGISSLIPNIDFFIKMHKVKEATASSQIEGTQTSLEEALQKLENIPDDRRDDWEEVHNYINAMNYAIEEHDKQPLGNKLIQDTHRILLHGVRGQHKYPGEFRKSQCWIGGKSLQSAKFVPPHPDEVSSLMNDLEKFIQNDDLNISHLIKIGIAHYQFETIHPFCDGNGRIGRLLITLYLVNKKLLDKPALYISDFFEKNRDLYYFSLDNVRRSDDLIHWLMFFMECVISASESSISIFENIIKLKNKIESKLTDFGKRRKNAENLLLHLYGQPIVDAEDISSLLNISIHASFRLVNDFLKLGILKEKTGFKRNRIFSFDEYLELFR